MVPFLEVSHLPSSSSFYSAVTQPLGLRYLYAVDSTLCPSVPQSITFGTATSPSTPVFELRQVTPSAERPLRLSHIVLTAGSPSAVEQFKTIVQRIHLVDGKVLHPEGGSLSHRPSACEPLFFAWSGTAEAGEAQEAPQYPSAPWKTTEQDPDGNIMELVYVPPADHSGSRSGSTIRKTNSTTSDISRIMTWNYDVAAADNPLQASLGHLAPVSPGLQPARRPGRFPDDDMAPMIRRTVTTSTTTYEPIDTMPSPRQHSNGMTTGALVGTLLGVAAASAAIGAGVAYSAMKTERGRNDPEVPPFLRRSTYPEPQTCGDPGRHLEYGQSERDRTSISERRPLPGLLTRYPHSQGPRDGGSVYDSSSIRLSSRCKPTGTVSDRTRSEVSSSRRPLLLTDADHRSHASSARTSELADDVHVLAAGKHSVASSRHTTSVAPRSKHTAAPLLRRSSTYDDAGDRDRDSYVSTRSRRTASTVRPLPVSVQTELSAPSAASLVHRSRVASQASSTKIKTSLPSAASRRQDPSNSNVETPRASSRAVSQVSARRIPLPISVAGRSQTVHEEEDDACSIAPSDSISCVGSRNSARMYN